MGIQETVRITMAAALELIDTAAGERVRNHAARITVPRGIRWHWKEDGYIVLTGTAEGTDIPVTVESMEYITLHCKLPVKSGDIHKIAVYPSPGGVRRPGKIYREGLTDPDKDVWAEVEETAGNILLKQPYDPKVSGQTIQLMARKRMNWLGQSFLLRDGAKEEQFTILDASGEKEGKFLMDHTLTSGFGTKAVVSQIVRTRSDESGRYLLALPTGVTEIRQIHD